MDGDRQTERPRWGHRGAQPPVTRRVKIPRRAADALQPTEAREPIVQELARRPMPRRVPMRVRGESELRTFEQRAAVDHRDPCCFESGHETIRRIPLAFRADDEEREA